MTRQELLSGKEFEFSNEEYQQSIQEDDLRIATVGYSHRINSFYILFNGEYIHSSKTFPTLQNALKKLSLSWNLKPNN